MKPQQENKLIFVLLIIWLALMIVGASELLNY